ncbi:MAG: GNAT family N-acetyltransferase [Clostridia bacterium]|nr:GNAT family N-acetyltransferase [Clostridia bacterium]
MMNLTPFGMTWNGDWNLFTRMAAAYQQELSLPDGLSAPEVRTRLIQRCQHQHNPLILRKIDVDGACVGFICCTVDDDAHAASLLAITLWADKRRQGHGSAALRRLERELRQRDVTRVTLAGAPQCLPFWEKQGYAYAGDSCSKALPRRNETAPVQLLIYTREPLDESIYAPKLADSVHFALIEDGECMPLLHNSGVVYARAVPGEMGVLHPYSLRRPWLIRLGGHPRPWAILAERIECDGTPDAASEDHVLLFISDDLIHWVEQPLLHISDPLAQEYLDKRRQQPDLPGLDLPEGCIPGNVVPLSEAAARRLRTRFLTPVNVSNDVPAEVEAASPADLADVRATARYSDGSSVVKRVDWDTRAIDWTKPGRYGIAGRVHQDRYEFPSMWNKADPAVCRWQGRYYFISTNDLDGNHTLFIREADSLPGLVTAQQTCILDTTMYPHLGSLLWAPEFHEIGGKLYIFHAGTPGPFGQEQSHVMALKPGGNPMKAADWEMPRRVVKKDGSMLYDKGITLDMTVFWSAGRLYASWSQRQFDPVDLGAWLYIAELDPAEPWRLLSDPQVLTVPEYGWENNHTFVVEGPFALKQGGRILLTYSGALVDSTYVVGLLSMADGADPLDPASWTKENYPLLTSRSVPGEFGPGHNAYVIDGDGLIWNTYHARPGVMVDGRQGFGPRSSGIRRVHMNAEGFPILDMTEEMDLDPKLAWVKTTVTVK